MKRLQQGFSAVEIVLVIVIVAVVGLVGWRVWDATQTPSSTADTSTPAQKDDATSINSEADLDKASKQLENADVGDSYSSELDSNIQF